MRKIRLIVVVFSIFLVSTVFAGYVARPWIKTGFVGQWVGYEKAFPHFYRLDLHSDGTGSLVTLYSDKTADVYSIAWDLTDSEFKIAATPASDKAEQITCAMGNFNYHSLQLVIKGSSGRWRREAVLLEETQLLRRITQSKVFAPGTRTNAVPIHGKPRAEKEPEHEKGQQEAVEEAQMPTPNLKIQREMRFQAHGKVTKGHHIGYDEAGQGGSRWDGCMNAWKSGSPHSEGSRNTCPPPVNSPAEPGVDLPVPGFPPATHP